MLSPADAELSSRDEALPGLAILLDPDALVSELRAALPQLDIECGVPTYTRYKPHTSCVVAYRVRVSGEETIGYAKTFSDASVEKIEKARYRVVDGVAARVARSHVEAPGFLFFFYPNDRKLEVLRRIGEAEARRQLLSKTVSDDDRLWRCEVEPLSYKPERRFVGSLVGPDGPEAAIRFYTELDFANANCGAKHLKSRDRMRVARRIGAWKRRHVLALEWMSGSPFDEALLTSANPHAVCEAAGAGLAEFHAQREQRLPIHGTASEQAALAAAAESLKFLCPGLEKRVDDLTYRISRELALQPPVDDTLHGDFYAGQILVEEDQVVFLDLDRACRGDRSVDLGTFIAHVEWERATGRIGLEGARVMSGALLYGYETAAGMAPRGVEVRTAAGLLRLAVEPFRRRMSDWTRLTEEILERVEVNLGALASSHSVVSSSNRRRSS